MATITCPHCGAYSHFTEKYDWSDHVEGRGPVNFGAWRCDACGRPIVGERTGKDTFVDYHPKAQIRTDFPHVPSEIAADASEAHQCFAIDAYRATVAMARRAIQASALERGAPGKNLVEQIDWLASEKLITEQMKDVAHRIRLSGNAGAHPDKDGLKDVGQPEARAVLDFLDDFFRYVYEIPARLSSLGEP